MKKNYFKNIFFLFLLILLSISIHAQKKSVIWSQISTQKANSIENKFYKATPLKSTLFNVDLNNGLAATQVASSITVTAVNDQPAFETNVPPLITPAA